MRLILPWPPSTNHYWARNRNGSVRIGAAGLRFRQQTVYTCHQARIRGLTGRLSVRIEAYPPNRRRHDLDNLLKATLDALQHGGAYKDDSQIDRLEIERMGITQDGGLIVSIVQLQLLHRTKGG